MLRTKGGQTYFSEPDAWPSRPYLRKSRVKPAVNQSHQTMAIDFAYLREANGVHLT
jgi:hypothetical protein